MELPIKVEGVLFSKVDGRFQFLLIKRSIEDGGFWQPLTGTLEDGEKVLDCLRRELIEEIGTENPKEISEDFFRFDWKNKRGETIVELVYGVELEPNSKVVLSHEHTDYKWCEYEEAIQLLGRENNKKSLEAFVAAFSN